MATARFSIEDIEKAIAEMAPEEQQRLLHDLPVLLRLPAEELLWLKSAEPAFEFWENPEDAVYDAM